MTYKPHTLLSSQWIVIGCLSEDHITDSVEINMLDRFLFTLDQSQQSFIMQHGLQWSSERKYDSNSVSIAVKFDNEHAVEYMLRWR